MGGGGSQFSVEGSLIKGEDTASGSGPRTGGLDERVLEHTHMEGEGDGENQVVAPVVSGVETLQPIAHHFVVTSGADQARELLLEGSEQAGLAPEHGLVEATVGEITRSREKAGARTRDGGAARLQARDAGATGPVGHEEDIGPDFLHPMVQPQLMSGVGTHQERLHSLRILL